MSFLKKVFGQTHDSNFDTAMNYFMNRQFQEAVNMFDLLITKDPESHENYYFKAECLMALGRHEEALDSLEIAGKLNPKDNLMTASSKAICLEMVGKFNEALKEYRQLVKENEHDPNNVFLQGILYDSYCRIGFIANHKLHDYRQSIESYRKAIEIKPDFATAYSNISAPLWELSKKEKSKKKRIELVQQAIINSRKAIEIEPDSALSNYALANMYACLGIRPDEALQHLSNIPTPP